MEYANRSQEYTAEFDDKGNMTFRIDGKLVTKLAPWQKATLKSITGNLWEVTPSEDIWESGHISANALENIPAWKTFKKKPMQVHKNGNKEFLKKFAVNPKQVVPVINAIQYKMAILPYKDYFKLFKRNNGVRPQQFQDVINSFEMLEQARKDGIMNITPFIAAERKSPQELKKKYGKALWKKLCANTLHRNLAIANYYYGSTRMEGSKSDVLQKLSDLDTSALAIKGYSPEITHWIKNNKICNYSDMKPSSENFGKYLEWNNIVVDTNRMSRQLNMPYNPNWTKRKMKEKHDEYSLMFNQRQEEDRKARDEEYRKRMEKIEKVDLSSLFPVLEWDHCGVKATLLTTYKQIREEGTIMRHCVGSYAERAMEMNYAVVHLESESEKTTLGLSVSKVPSQDYTGWEYLFSFNQHYGICNAQVVSQEHKELQEIVIGSLNDAKIKVKKESDEK